MIKFTHKGLSLKITIRYAYFILILSCFFTNSATSGPLGGLLLKGGNKSDNKVLNHSNYKTVLADGCSPVSTLPCSDLQVGLPYTLTFTDPVANTLPDKNGAGTGFTTVNTYSGTRLSADGQPANTSVPGYEPSKITLTGGRLQLVTNKGIDFQTNNNQINLLGVKTAAVKNLQMEVKVINPVNKAQSQQAGLWYGLHDKTFIKLGISANKVELRKERNDISSTTAGTSNPDQRITAVVSGLNSKTVQLRMVIDSVAGTVNGFYSIDGGTTFINVGTGYSATGLDISAMNITGGNSYAGIFATYRNGTVIDTYTFDDFAVKDLTVVAPSFQTVNISFRPQSSAALSGYTSDNGLAFDASRKFGWISPTTKLPVDLKANMRQRTGTADARQLSHVEMQNNTGGQVPGSWEYVVPNGSYRVTVSAGDFNFIDSDHQVNVEGLPTITDFIATMAGKFRISTATVTVSDGKLTVDAAGGDHTKINFINISQATAITDASAPTAGARFVGTLKSANIYSNQVQVLLTASDVGASGLASLQYSINNGTYINYTAPFTLTASGAYALKVKAVDGNNNTTTTGTYNFSVVGSVSLAGMVLKNMNLFPADDQLVFSYINTPWRRTSPVTTEYNANHDKVTLRINSTGNENLTVRNLTLSNSSAWKILSVNGNTSPSLPITINAGAYADVTVQFMARNFTARIVTFSDTLTIVSNDATSPAKKVMLRGIWQRQGEGNYEPYAQEIISAFGFKSIVGYNANDGTVKGKTIMPNSSEIAAAYFVKADNSKPVTVYQMASYHGCCSTALVDTIKYVAKGSTVVQSLFAHNYLDSQSLLPRLLSSSTAPAMGTFNPTGAFRLAINTSSSDRTQNYGKLIGLRILKVVDSEGNIVPNAYFINVDYLGNTYTNYDYQDGIYYIENIKPETVAAISSDLTAASEANLRVAEEETPIGKILVYPNPSSGNDILLTATDFGTNEEITISVTSNMSDRKLHSEKFVTDQSGSASLKLKLKNRLSRGIYILNTESKSGIVRSRLLVE
ncbi:OmpL47-type beta-barrel domain-containing protein [Dyadobacter sp. NIV53]|uniref:OmpL47-type beta-barrel domain-containing protein n=1 Tax=Dyadobacter sp. NIV53 TaxID=2861765 RepID=UPI001C876A16|nr:T9SS type A sorting domain-containing protein [Dyadobacter sp. NIV53]